MDVSKGEMRYATAGHSGPVVIAPGCEPRGLKAEGFPIGLFPGARYDEFRVDLSAGDRIYFYSDGVTDAMNPKQDEFGYERLLDLVSARRNDDIETVVQAIGRAVNTWADGEPSHDDVSILGLEVTR